MADHMGEILPIPATITLENGMTVSLERVALLRRPPSDELVNLVTPEDVAIAFGLTDEERKYVMALADRVPLKEED